MSITIGVEIDGVANPHRIARGPRTLGDLLGGVAFKIEDVKTISLSAAVTFLRSKIARLRGINNLGGVGRKITGAGFGHWQRFGRPTINRHRIKTCDRQGP